MVHLATAVPAVLAASSPHTPTLAKLIWLIPTLPAIAFVVLFFFGRRIGEPAAGIVATAGMGLAFVVSVLTWWGLKSVPGDERHFVVTFYQWLPSGRFQVDMGFLVDPLSVTMCLFVTFVGSFIFLYSIGYMKGDPSFTRFFMLLSFFSLSMLMLVTGSSLLVTFLGWEGVGAASYFLIGFWYQDIKNSSAGTKAFVTNRVGDWGFMVAMLWAFFAFGTLNYGQIFTGVHGVARTTLTVMTVLILIAATGKSAQLPLYLWLPDAMAGPTPVSALMHAATMVTAGVFLLVRMNPVIAAGSPWAGTLIAWVGAITAIFAATIAISQRDIKKVLAYSTVSQLAYMVMAVGSGAYVAAIFHMITHAFFKALLFLGAGSVITGMANEQDMDYMGKLRKFMPVTCVTFIIASLSIAGIFPFAGQWSKGEILAYAWQKSPALWAIGFVTAGLTAYYMFREVFLVFYGDRRWTEFESVDAARAAAHHHPTVDAEGNPLPTGPGSPHHVEHGAPVLPKESPWVMLIPLIVLAVGATVLGVLGLPFGDKFAILGNWLEPSVAAGELSLTVPGVVQFVIEVFTILLAVGGILVAAAIYLRKKRAEQIRYEPEILANAWYYDIAVTRFMGGPGLAFYNWVSFWFDRYVIDGAANGLAWLSRYSGQRLRRLQTGYLRNYALGIAGGTMLLIAYVLARAAF